MRIGLTYDLRSDYLAAGYAEEQTAEFDRESTIEAIEASLRALGHETDRIGRLAALVERLAALPDPGASEPQRPWDLVFNIAEGLHGLGREGVVPALLDAYRIPYTFSDPLVQTLTLHKGMTKRVVRDLGLPTPDFALIETEADIANVSLPFPLFAKPVAEGTSKGVDVSSRIRNPQELAAACRRLLAEFRQPVLVETFLPGREFTVGIVGTAERARAVGAMEVNLLAHADAGVYTYRNKERCEELVRYSLPEPAVAAEAESLALAAWRGLGCRDAGRVDVRADAGGRLGFIEVNPLPGLHPRHSDLPILCTLRGVSYGSLIGQIVESAMERVPLAAPLQRRPQSVLP